MDRRAPIILLIEDDEADRRTLARMLGERGYKVMPVSRGAGALNTFVIHHLHIALVLVRAQLSDHASAGLFSALYRIDRRVPILAAEYAPRGLSAVEDAERSLAFAELIRAVHDRLHTGPVARRRHSTLRANSTAVRAATFFADGLARRSTGRAHRELRWPLRDEEVDEIEWGDAIEDGAVANEFHADTQPPTRVLRSDPLMPIARPDRTRYLARLRRERVVRRRIGQIGVTVAGSVLIATALLEMRSTTARAISQDATVTVPLPAAPISGRVGLVQVVSAERVSPSSLADDLLPALSARGEVQVAPPRFQRSRQARSGRR